MRRILSLVSIACVVGLPVVASAQTATPRPSSRIGFRVFGLVDSQQFAAKDTFEAFFGTSRLIGFGGGVEIDGIWRGLFLRGAVSRMTKSGERVFVFEREVFPLGIPMDVTMTPLEIAAGWRAKPMGKLRFTPHVGAGMLTLNYKETGDFADTGENVSDSYRGLVVFAGASLPVWRRISLGAEAQYRHLPESIGKGGASEAFGEDSIGGVTLRVMAIIGR